MPDTGTITVPDSVPSVLQRPKPAPSLAKKYSLSWTTVSCSGAEELL